MEALEDIVLFLVERVNKRARRYAQRRMDDAEMGVSVDQWVVLKVVEGHNGKSQREIARASERDAASITRTLDLLEQKGLVERAAIAGDRRQYAVTLTKLGEAFIDQHMPLIKSLRKAGLKGIPSSEVKTLRETLQRMSDNFNDND